MRRLAVFTLVALATSCLPFDGLLEQCQHGEAPCDSGVINTGGGGGGGGGGDAGGGGGSHAGGGTGGGSQTGGSGGGAGGFSNSDGGAICFDGFCWENPLPQGNDLGALWGSGPDDVWAGGDGNALIHWDGQSWQSFQFTPSGDPSDAIFTLFGVDGQVFAGGALTRALVFSGGDGAWHEAPSSPLAITTLGGDSAHALYAGTGSNGLWRLDGGVSAEKVVATSASIDTLTSDRDGGVYYGQVDIGNRVRHCIGACVTPVEVGTFSDRVIGISALDDGRLRVQLANGSTWLVLPGDGGTVYLANTSWNALAADLRGDETGFVVGGAFNIARAVPGGGWAAETATAPPGYDTSDLYAVWTASGLTGSWATGAGGVLLQYDGSHFVAKSSGFLDTVAVGLATPFGILAWGASGTLHLRDPQTGAWQDQQTPGAGAAGCVYPDGGVVLAGVSGAMNRWPGPSPAPLITLASLTTGGGAVTGVGCLPNGSLFAATDNGRLFRFNQGSWVLEHRDAGETFGDIDGLDDTHVWAAATNGLEVRDEDAGWHFVPVDNAAALHTVWLDVSTGRLWFGGGRTSAHDYLGYLDVDGGGVTETYPEQTNSDLVTIRGSGGDDLWAAGSQGGLWRWNGTSWSAVEMGSRKDINRLVLQKSPDGGTDLWMLGDNGSVLRKHY